MVGFNTQPPEGSWQQLGNGFERHRLVSTHSRPKAAGLPAAVLVRCRLCFNTQPPEGGWHFTHYQTWHVARFNTQPPEGGWREQMRDLEWTGVSTHSRPKAAGTASASNRYCCACFNTQPPEGGWVETSRIYMNYSKVSTHSRPKAAGGMFELGRALIVLFQHTAARRRLAAQIK